MVYWINILVLLLYFKVGGCLGWVWWFVKVDVLMLFGRMWLRVD